MSKVEWKFKDVCNILRVYNKVGVILYYEGSVLV